MAPESRVLDTPNQSPAIETAHLQLEPSQVVKFSSWLEAELDQLEEKFRRFSLRRKFVPFFRS